MSTIDDTAIAIADEYAEAALALADTPEVADTFLSELGDFVAFMKSDEDFCHFMESPLIEPENRCDVLERTLRGKMSDLVLNAILVLNNKERSELIPLFYERCRLALAQRRNEVDVLVTTAHPLTVKLRERLTTVLEYQTGRKPCLVEHVDPSTIAGVKLQIENEVLDNSAASHLRRMREAFLERASRELQAGKLPVEDK